MQASSGTRQQREEANAGEREETGGSKRKSTPSEARVNVAGDLKLESIFIREPRRNTA
jgi:hypothetical protein